MSNSLLPDDPAGANGLESSPLGPGSGSTGGEYVVVARRYRPQTFDQLVGQEHVGRALSNAINTHRVGHAYLFTGARGVGKTSAARIFAKALNCQQGTPPEPCGRCDICQAIAAGDDVDVLEIDGASNRGIDEIRQVRQTVAVRPSRSRFKIYIIDEVHMLTREAFNALLKTLEEPPEHVKFFFCTTEAEKIPITILSRCQRFDFAGIQTRSIAERLAQIVAAEGVTAEPAALELLARRAAGSMRDSQSLLEQLLSFGGQRLTLADVHALLGTADDQRIGAILAQLVARNPAGALAELDAAATAGVDVGRLLDQLLGLLRDVLVASVGAAPEAFLHVSPGGEAAIVEAARALRPARVLAMMQILDHALGRLRYSTQARIIAEMALVRVATIGDLDDLARIVDELRDGAAPDPSASRAAARPAIGGAAPRIGGAMAAGDTAKKNYLSSGSPRGEAPADERAALADGSLSMAASSAAATGAANSSAVSSGEVISSTAIAEPPGETSVAPRESVASDLSHLTEQQARSLWDRALADVVGMLRTHAAACEAIRLQPPNRVVAQFPAKYAAAKAYCERAPQAVKLEQALTAAAGQAVKIEFSLLAAAPGQSEAEVASGAAPSRPKPTPRRDHPLVRHAQELFDADVTWLEAEPKRPPDA